MSGHTADEAERELMGRALANQHISDVETCAIALANRTDGSIGLVLIMDSCCGRTSYGFEVDVIPTMIEGLHGALKVISDQAGKAN